MACSSLDESGRSSLDAKKMNLGVTNAEHVLSADAANSGRVSPSADSTEEPEQTDMTSNNEKTEAFEEIRESTDIEPLPEREEHDAANGVQEPEPETPKMTHDSMVTVRLSEPPSLTLNTTTALEAGIAKSRPLGGEVRCVSDVDRNSDDSLHGGERRNSVRPRLQGSTTAVSSTEPSRSLRDESGHGDADGHETDSSEDEVDWEQLERTEDEQTKDEDTDNSTALLLARLEEENAKLATNPRSVKVHAVETQSTCQSRPPSMAQLRRMVQGPTPAALRYSMLPPPPMTDLEFYAALVKDYQQTAARLPTLLSNKIRKGIPPPLRGVVWQSMSGARDAGLEEQYERFCGESSPYELLIGKDLGRSFPGVDMFRDPDGDGQRMLGRVLKSFSLYDTKIGYCQGLAFLVGPLLMHMPDKQAFCVLVRLMDKYDLRDCFLPDLSGLHVRIYQFRELLRLILPALSSHLEDLQVETAYVSQWFLSFFAVTCPLPMLFRIYDVIFAEGASETLMRVALSLMRMNEARLLACTELEDAMQLLLSRGLWDCYHYDADKFVQDFAGLSSVVTRERLSQLEQAHRESLIATVNTARTSDVATAASRFLGRIWTSSGKNSGLAPGTAAIPSRPISLLRRSTSKQSLASTLNSIEPSSASVTSSSSTSASTISRDSAAADQEHYNRGSTPVGPKITGGTKPAEDRYLHNQIEDLLTALGELQRNHTIMSNQLQSEREEREEDKKAVRSLLDGLRKRATSRDSTNEDSNPLGFNKCEPSEGEAEDGDATPTTEEPRQTTEAIEARPAGDEDETPSTEDLSELLDRVESRFAVEGGKKRSSTTPSKAQLRDELLNTKTQLASAISHSQELDRRIHSMDQELSSLREQLRDRHGHVRTLHQDKQRLEKQIHGLRSSLSSGHLSDGKGRDAEELSVKSKNGGLREFKLGRSQSTPSQAPFSNKRVSSLPQNSELVSVRASADATPPNDHEALLLELVQAKTAEAVARQEAEEARQKLEALRKSHGLHHSESSGQSPPSASTGAMGVLGRLTGQAVIPHGENAVKPPATSSSSSLSTGGFWGWRR